MWLIQKWKIEHIVDGQEKSLVSGTIPASDSCDLAAVARGNFYGGSPFCL